MGVGVLLAAVDVGGYISIWKTIPVLLVLLVYARLMTWADKDAVDAQLPRVALNSALLGALIFGFLLFFWLPLGYFLNLLILVVVLSLAFGSYLVVRQQKVGLGDLSASLKQWAGSLFSSGKPKEVKVGVGQVQLFSKAGAAQPVPTAEDPNREAYEASQTILTDALQKGAERIDVAPSDAAAGIKYQVDGMTYSGGSLNRQGAAAAVMYLKALAGLDLNEKRKPQRGTVKATIDGNKKELQLTTAGSAQGEFLTILVDPKKRHSLTLDDLGFDDSQLETMKGMIADKTGIVLVAAPKGTGLTTLLYAILRAHDAFLTHIHTIERGIDEDLEGITQNKIAASATPAEEHKQVAWVASQDPDVIMITEITDPKSAQELAKFARSGKRVYVGVRANSTFDALATWQKLVGNDDVATRNLAMVIAGRVLRRLCAACKVGYTPEPTTLRKLNMDPDKISKLYQARQEPLRDQRGNPVPCEFCKELRFKGRIGVYEILVVDDDARNVIQQGGSVNQLKAVFRKQRSRYLQEQALQLVEAGETSIQEVLRVLKTDAAQPSSAGGSGKPPAAPSRPAAG
jgi:general secretion pathway protein E